MSTLSLTYRQSVFKRQQSNKEQQTFLRLIHKIAMKTSWHRYGTKLRHYYPMYICSKLATRRIRVLICMRCGLIRVLHSHTQQPSFPFFFRTDYMDSPDRLLSLLSISVFYFLVFFLFLHFSVVGSVR